MTTYKTGNPIGSADPKDLYDNAENLDTALNSQGNTWADRFGVTRPTYQSAIDPTGLVQDAVGAAVRAEAAADAATVAGRVFDTPEDGLAETGIGQYFSVPASDAQDALILYRNSGGNALEIKRYPSTLFDSLTANRGKNHPLRPMVRDGVLSDPSPVWNGFVLDAQVLNAQPGKLYQLSYYQNGAVVGTAGYGWVIREFDESTYATAAGEGRFIVNYNDALQMPVDRSRGIQQIRLRGTDGVEVQLVVDPAGLPPDGTPINSNTFPTHQAWSWVIDPAVYMVVKPACLTLRRNTVRSVGNDFLNKALLNVRVIGARPGQLYGIRYFKNGSTALSGPPDGWVIEEQDATEYAASGSALVVVNYTDPAPDVPRGGVRLLTLDSQVVEGLRFVVTLNTDELPVYGTAVRMNGPTWPGYSWAIDPTCYSVRPDAIGSRLNWRTTADKRMIVTYQSGDYWYRMTIGPNGRNALPNVSEIAIAPRTGRAAGAFTVLWSSVTDWLPPLRVMAQQNGVPLPNGRIFTGGNHGSDGSGGGEATAANIMWDCIVDGAAIPWAEATGMASRIEMRIANDVMAANTIATEPPRYVLREHFRLVATAAGIGLSARRVANEAIDVITDYGVQATTAGFQGEMLYVGGLDASWIPYSATTDSGAKSLSPDAWAVALRSANGQLLLWQDRQYEAGDGRYVADDWPILRAGGTTHKVYGGLIGNAAGNTAISFMAGSAWSWRGGWSIQSPGLAPTAMDSVAQLQTTQEVLQAFISDAHAWVVI